MTNDTAAMTVAQTSVTGSEYAFGLCPGTIATTDSATIKLNTAIAQYMYYMATYC